MQVGIPFEVIGPDGTRAVLNDRADPDFVGFLDPDSGIAGLDGATIRTEALDYVERDGGAHGDFYAGRMPFTLQGWLDWEGRVVTTQREDRLKRATKALRADGIFRWTPDGGEQRQVSFRRVDRPSISGRIQKRFQLSLESASHRIVAASESSVVIVAGAATGVIGFASPIRSPLSSAPATTGAVVASNTGDEPAPPRMRLDGPITNPVIRNATTGEELELAITLAAGEWLAIDADGPDVLLNGTVDRYRAVQFPGSRWWNVQPGANDVRLLAAAYSTPAQLTVYWRNSWA